MLVRIIIFLALNFLALFIGGSFTSKGVASEWYIHLDKASWTPPGWTFGAVWSFIMIAFAVYMAYAWEKIPAKKLLAGLYIVQWILNVTWNPVFFYYHNALAGLIIIASLTIVVAFFLLVFRPLLRTYTWLALPYFLWLLVAASLNGYIFLKN